MNISKNQAIKVLDEMYTIATHASLTGALRGGLYTLICTFNKIRDYAIEKDWIDGDLILEVTDNGRGMDDIGVSAKLLAEMLKVEEVEDEKEYDENGYEIMPE
jgi:hypothetical protein